MAKKMDRFGWERDRGSAAHDRLMTDWMAALQDYPLDEVQAACRAWVKANPRKMPNEGDILGQLGAIRRDMAQAFIAQNPPEPEPERERCDPKAAAEIIAKAGFAVKRMPK